MKTEKQIVEVEVEIPEGKQFAGFSRIGSGPAGVVGFMKFEDQPEPCHRVTFDKEELEEMADSVDKLTVAFDRMVKAVLNAVRKGD